MNEEGWFAWAAVRNGDQVWMGGRDGAFWKVDEDPLRAPDGWADVPTLWVVIAGHGTQVLPGERVWCRPATYRPQDETRDAERAAVGIVLETLGGVEVGWTNERRG